MSLLFIIISTVWALSELLLTRLFRSGNEGSKEFDKRSLSLIWVTLTVSIMTGVFLSKATFHPFTSSEATSYTGLALIVTGMVIRFLAIRALGKFFTVDLTFQKEQSLIKEGLYKHIRHPAYAGSLLSFLGLGLALNNWLSTLIVFIPVFLSMLYRIRLEEKMLLEKTGAEYREYMQHTRRLIPKIF
jgi:protein-S-isoprenylcysteine O-methyltransferase Ste14